MAPLITKRAQVGVEIEAVEGTAEVLANDDFFEVFNPTFEPMIEMNERNPVRTSLSARPSVVGARSAKVTFETEVVGTAAAGSALAISDALRACGVAEALGGPGVSATYTPASASIPSVTIGVPVDGKRRLLWGARGTAKLILEAGKPGMIQWEFTAADWSEVDGALYTPTYNTVLPPPFIGATMTIDGYAAIISKLEIDLGAVVGLRKSANASSGHVSAVITDRRARLTIDPEEILLATHDFITDFRAGTQVALSCAWGSAAGNTHTITAPKVQYHSLKPVSRDGFQAYEIECLLAADSGDDEWSYAVT